MSVILVIVFVFLFSCVFLFVLVDVGTGRHPNLLECHLDCFHSHILFQVAFTGQYIHKLNHSVVKELDDGAEAVVKLHTELVFTFVVIDPHLFDIIYLFEVL